MAELFRRVVDLVVGGQRIRELHATFNVTKTLAKTPNTLDLKTWNLAPASRGLLAGKGIPIIVVAGYEGNAAQLFAGDSRTCDHVQDGPNWITRVQCGDGEKAYSTARASLSFAPGTSVKTVLFALADHFGLSPGNAKERIGRGNFRAGFDSFASGYSSSGKVPDEFDRLLRSAGLSWSIQDGALQVLGSTETLEAQAVVLSPETGLIGSPAHGTPEKDGKPSLLKARSLLQPALKPGARVELRSRSVNGAYRIQRVVHDGDTAGGPWYSDVEVLPVT